MDSTGLASYADEGGYRFGDGHSIGAVENWGGLWLLDFHMRMRKRFHYKEIIRNKQLEEEKLRETAWCELFQARILPKVCRLRKQCGFDCDACRGLSILVPS